MRENRTHGSEGGDGESRFRPLSPSQNGGVEWDAYGHYHYEQLDMGNLTKLEPPPLLESDKLESLQLCALAYFIPR